MADKFWVGGTGTWDAATTTNWSLTSGGAGGAAVPTTADRVVFDSASNVAGSGASYTVTRTAITNVLGINMSNPSAGTLTFAGSSVIGVTTSGLAINGTVNWTNTGILTFSGTTAIFFTAPSIIASPIVINGTGITVTLNGAVSTSSTLTLTAGTLALSTFVFTAATANISGSTTRTFNFGTGNLTLTGSGTTIFTATTQTGLTVSGTPVINCTYSGSVGTRTIASGATATTLSFNITAGTDTIAFTASNRVNNLNFTGFGGTVSNIAISIYGNLTLSSTAGFTLTAGVNTWTFASTTTGKTVTTAGTTLDFPVSFSGAAGAWTLQDALTLGTNRTISFLNGTVNLNNFTLTAGQMVMGGGAGTNNTLNVGTAVNIYLTGNNATVYSFTAGGVSNLFSVAPIINFTYAGATGTRTISTGVAAIYLNITAGTDIVILSAGSIGNLNFTGFAGTLSASTGALSLYGSLTLSSGMAQSSSGALTFAATSTGKTITSNGKTLPAITFNGVGGGWTLADALNIGANTITVTNGSFDTGSYSVAALGISVGAGTKTITLGTSTLTLSGQIPINISSVNATGLTFSAASSTINCTYTAAADLYFFTYGQTFGTVTFGSTPTRYWVGITGSAPITFTDLNVPAKTSVGVSTVNIAADITVTGTLTVSGGTAINRNIILSDTIGTARTITAANVSLTDVDFYYITGAGAATWSGTRLGRVAGNSDITFDAPKTVYWNLAGTQNWSANGWAPYSGGPPAANNFPLAQDTCIINNSSLGTGLVMDQSWYIGTLDTSARTTAFNMNFGNIVTNWCGDIIYVGGVSQTSATSNTFNFVGGIVQNAGVWSGNYTINSPSGTLKLNNPVSTSGNTLALTLTNGTLDLNNYQFDIGTFSSNNSNIRAIKFGTTGYISLKGAGTVWDTTTVTNLTTSGTTRVDCTGTAAGARTIIAGGLSEDYAISFNIAAGSGPFTFTANDRIKNLNFTGFAGSWINVALGIYGSLTVSTGVTVLSGSNTVSFLSTYTGKTITSNGKTLGFPILFNGLFGSWTLQDNMTTGTTATSIVTHAAGTLNLNDKTLTCPAFATNSTYARTLAFGIGSITVNGTGTVWDATNVTNMTVTGTPTVNVTSSSATARTITAGSPSETNSISFNVSAGTSSTTVTGSVRNLIFTGSSVTWPNSTLTVYGNLTLSTGMTVTAGANFVTFASTSTGKTITSNGKTLGCPITFDGVGGGWTLADAIILGANALTLTNGSFNTGNFNVTAGSVSSNNSNTRSLTLGSSTLTLSSWDTTTATGLTLSTGTSTIILSGTINLFNGGGQTYYNVSFTSGGSTVYSTNNITGSNTFANLTFAGRTVTGTNWLLFAANQTIGTLTIGAGTGPAYRTWLTSSVFDTQVTLTVASISSLTDIDFRDIVVAGTSGTWSGTRLGDCGHNSNITFDVPKTVYWNLTGVVNWSANGWAPNSGGIPATTSFPLAQDIAIFDQTGAATTVTVDGLYNIGTVNMSTRTTAMTLAFGSGYLFPYGDFILGTGVTPTTLVGYLLFAGYNKTQTLTTAGKSIPFNITAYAPSTTILLGGALTTTNSITLLGSFDTSASNYAVTASSSIQFSTGSTGTIKLNGSIVTLLGAGVAWLALSTNTVNAGTSTITMSGAAVDFYGGGKTYNNVSFTNTAITTCAIRDANTFANLNIPARTGSLGISNIVFYANQTVTGTLTIGAGTSAIYRTFLQSDTVGTARTITAAAKSAFTDVDFRDITAAGASGTWSGTRLGDCKNNSNITFTAKNVYWNLAGSQVWSANGWTFAPGGAPNAIYFPLAQDMIIFNQTASIATTLTLNANWNIGTIDYSARTTATTLAFSTFTPVFYGNITLYSALTTTNTSGAAWFMGGTQTINTAGVAIPALSFYIKSPNTTVRLGAAMTIAGQGFYLDAGTLDLNNFTLTALYLYVNNTAFSKAIAFGTGSINVTGNNAGVIGITGTNFTYTGTPTVNLTYSGATATRYITSTTTESNSLDINVTAGTDIVWMLNGAGIRNYNDTGFTGTYNTASNVNIYGNLTNNSAGLVGFVNFVATSGTKTLTVNNVGNYCGALLTFNCPGATYQLGSNINADSNNITTSSYVFTLNLVQKLLVIRM